MSVAQYLRRHAQPEIELVAAIDASYDHVVVVPAYDESPALVDGLATAVRTASGSCLALVVVNATDEAPFDAHVANTALLDALRARPSDAEPAIVVIDRATAGRRLPPKQGVGLARRIGCDIALALRAAGKLSSEWIHTTDADATLPAGYFDAARTADDGTVALTYPFVHAPPDDESMRAAAIAYDSWLRYYVGGLAWAGSPYAFHTIGSTIAVHADAYAAVRGVPMRRAGEDFYLLNKLAKLGRVHQPDLEPIRLSARQSTRVPFGTGPGIAKMAKALAAGVEPLFYDPRAFAALRTFLTALEVFASSGKLSLDRDSALASAASELGVSNALASARRATATTEALRRRIHQWFDGFRSRQLIHALRRHGLSDVPMTAAFESAPFWPLALADK